MNEERPFQYSLRTLFIILTVSAVLLGIFAPVLRTLSPQYLVMLAAGITVYAGCVLLLTLVVSLIGRLKTSDPLSPRRLAAFQSEWQAEALVEALAGENIRAMAVGGFTSGFRAEAPGQVEVVVAARDLLRASEILEELRAEEDAAEFEREADDEDG